MGKHYRKRKIIESKLFVKTYMHCDYNWEVAEKLGMPVNTVATKAANLRKLGVNLPFRYPHVDVDELNDTIAAIEKELSAKSIKGNKGGDSE